MTSLPQDPERYSVLGTFDSSSPKGLADKRLFGDDRNRMYVEFYGPVSMGSVVDWSIAGRIKWVDVAAKERVLAAARADLSAAFERSAGSVQTDDQVVARRAQGKRHGGASVVMLFAVVGAFIALAIVLVGIATDIGARRDAMLDQADQTSREIEADRAAQTKRREDIMNNVPNALPPSKDPRTERAFLRAAQDQFRSDPAAMACIGRINRVDLPSKGVVDIYTTAWPPDLRPIIDAVAPEIFGDGKVVVNTRSALDGHIQERMTRDPAGPSGITFP